MLIFKMINCILYDNNNSKIVLILIIKVLLIFFTGKLNDILIDSGIGLFIIYLSILF